MKRKSAYNGKLLGFKAKLAQSKLPPAKQARKLWKFGLKLNTSAVLYCAGHLKQRCEFQYWRSSHSRNSRVYVLCLFVGSCSLQTRDRREACYVKWEKTVK